MAQSRPPDAAEARGYQRRVIAAAGMKHPVYTQGEGPVVLLLHELPALAGDTIELAEQIRARGYRVVLPAFLDTVAETTGLGTLVANTLRICVSWQFAALLQRRTSRITEWLLAIGDWEMATSGRDRVGVIGMCLSGSFALAAAVDPRVALAVVAQPGLPFAVKPLLDRIPGQKADLGISEANREALVARRNDVDGLCIRGYRYTTDRISPPERLDRLEAELGPAASVLRIPIDGHAHPVLTDAAEAVRDGRPHPSRQALDDLFAHLAARLPVVP